MVTNNSISSHYVPIIIGSNENIYLVVWIMIIRISKIINCKRRIKEATTSRVSEVTSSVPDTISTAQPTTASKLRLPKLVLPKFKGDVKDWTSFWDSFNSSVHEKSISQASCSKITTVKDRRDIVLKSGCCFNRLKTCHKSRDCNSQRNVDTVINATTSLSVTNYPHFGRIVMSSRSQKKPQVQLPVLPKKPPREQE